MIIGIRDRLQMDGRMAVCNLMKYQIFSVQTVERISMKINQRSFVYNYFSFVFPQFSLSADFIKFVATLNRARLGCCLLKSAAPQQISRITRFDESAWADSSRVAEMESSSIRKF